MENLTYLECLRKLSNMLSELENNSNQAKWLLCHILDIDFNQMLLSMDKITKEQSDKIMESANRLLEGYPLQYLIGSTEFMGLEFKVAENVLIPRNDTEVLVDHVIKHIGDKAVNVIDMCCGSGCIGLSIKHYCKNANVTLCDISDYALNLTKENAKLLNLDVNIIKTDLFTNVNDKFDVLVSNPPYIESCEIDKLSKQVQCEPRLALDGKEDGLFFYRRIANECGKVLNDDATIFLEIGHNQGKSVSDLFETATVYKDLQGRDRVIIARR